MSRVSEISQKSKPVTKISNNRGLLGIGGVLIFILIWETASQAQLLDRRFFPSFLDTIGALFNMFGRTDFWLSLWDTMWLWAIGLSIASVAAIILGIFIGSNRVLREVTASTIEFLRPIPSVALIPLAVLLYGSGPMGAMILIIYGSFWQVIMQVLYGVGDVDPVARDTAKAYRFSRLRIIRTVIWPTALPYVMTGFRLAAAVALILVVTAGLVMGSPGLGNLLVVSQQSGAYANMFAVVMVTGVIGLVINLFARFAELRLLRWHISVRR